MPALRVALVCADRGVAPGGTKGASSHLRGVARGLQQLGHDVVTFAAREPEGAFPTAVHPLPAMRACTVDLVYERYSLDHAAGLDRARSLGVPFVLEVNAPLVLEASLHRPETVTASAPATEVRLLREADLVVSVSRPLERWIHARRSGPTVVVRNGFEPDWFSEPAQSEAGTLAFLGHPKPWHGAEALIPLLRRLEQAGRTANLLVIGGGPGAAELERLAQAEGVEHLVSVTGSLPPDEASARLRTARVGLAPYPATEGFYFSPLKVVDYLAAGLPVVATALGDIPELVDDAGLLVPPGDGRAFAEAVKRLLDYPEIGRAMGTRGRERAFHSMTWAHAARRTLAALHSIAPHASRRSPTTVREVA